MSAWNPSRVPENEDAIDVELGPFQPPPDYDHGLEFQPDCPRPIPIEFRRSRYVRGRNAEVWIPVLVGIACFATDQLPFIQHLSWYLLPLGYLKWIGSACLAFAAFFWLRNQLTSGYLHVVKNCQPLVGRVRRVYWRDYWPSQAMQNLSRTHFVICADVEYREPHHGGIVRRVIVGQDYFQYKYLNLFDPGIKSGDYVTLVYDPDRLDKSFQIYGWLGVNPAVDFIRKSGKPLQPMSPWKVLLVIMGLMGLTWLVLGFMYVLGRYMPFDDGKDPSLLLVVLLLTMSLFAAGVGLWFVKRDRSQEPKSFKRCAFAAFSGLLVGFAISLFGMFFVNGALDSSGPDLVPIRIVQLWHQTFLELGVRYYQVEFEPYPQGARAKTTVTIEALQSFQPGGFGVLDVGKGWLGIPWVREIHPVTWHDIDPATADEDQGAITFDEENSQRPVTIVPRIIMADGSSFAPPPALLPELRQRMIQSLKGQRGRRVSP